MVDRVRGDQANLLCDSPSDSKVIKRSHWLLLRNRASLSGEQSIKLDEFLDAKAPLATVYPLNTNLKSCGMPPVNWRLVSAGTSD
ncbi:transposase [Nitrincola sp.]|uniref:transposase n=1 Tax=Nitrincola sp. TaxID=1926584 RepID=UPI003A94DCF0